MARGRKRSLTIDEEINQIAEDIKTKEQELDELKSRLSELNDLKKRTQLDELYELMMESGKSFEDIKKLITEEE